MSTGRVAPAVYQTAQWLAIAGAIGLPALALAFRGGANSAYFLMLLASLAGVAMHGLGAAPASLRHHRSTPAYRAFCVAMCLPLLAVLANQLATWEFDDRSFDAPSRMLLVMLIAWWLMRCPWQYLRHMQWGLCAGALIGAAKLAALSDFGATGRPMPAFATAISFGNLALLMGLCAFVSLGWRLTRWRLEQGVKILGGLAGLYGSFLSQSRGGWLALPILVIVLILLSRLSRRWKMLLAATALVAVGGIYSGSHLVQDRVQEAATELSEYARGANPDTSIGLRMQFWQASIDMFLEHPFTGVGLQNIQREFQQRAQSGEMTPTVVTFNHSHNDMLWAMAALGIPGMLALLAVYLVPLTLFVRTSRHADARIAVASRMGIVLVLGYMIFGFTEAMFAITMNTAFYAGMLAILVALTRGQSASLILAGEVEHDQSDIAPSSPRSRGEKDPASGRE